MMKPTRFVLQLACFCVLVGALRPALASGEEVVALHPLRGLGVDAETVENLQSIVYNEFNRVPGMRMVGAERARDLVDREDIECDGADACLAAFARDLGAGIAVYGAVGGLGESYSIALKAVDADSETARSRVDLQVGGEREVLIDGVRAGAYQLLRPDLYTGSLQLELPVEGAEVFVDGEMAGTTPLDAPVTGLEPGQRALKIVKTGFRDFDRFIEIRFQRTSVVTIDLEQSAVADVFYEEVPEAPEPELAAIAVDVAEEGEDGVSGGNAPGDAVAAAPAKPGEASFWQMSPMRVGAYALLAGGGLSLATGGYFGLSARSQERSLEKAFAEDEQGPGIDHLDDWNDAHRTARTANTLFVVGGAITAAGAGLLGADIFLMRDEVERTPFIAFQPMSGGPGLSLTLAW